MKNAAALITIATITIMSLVVLGYMYSQSQQNTRTTTPSPTAVTSSSPTPESTDNWVRFTDPRSGIVFRHPGRFNIETIFRDDGKGYEYDFEPGVYMTITVLNSYTQNQVEYFLNSPADNTVEIDGTIWSTYYLPTGYEDRLVGTGHPIVGLQAVIDDKLVSVTLSNQTEITDEQLDIIFSIAFTK